MHVCVLHKYPFTHMVSFNVIDAFDQSAHLPMVFTIIRTEEIIPLKSLCRAPRSFRTSKCVIQDYSHLSSEDSQLWWCERTGTNTAYKGNSGLKTLGSAGRLWVGQGGRERWVNQELLSGEDCPDPDWRLTLINRYSILVFNKCSIQEVFCNI